MTWAGRTKQVAVIGAGPAGLTAMKSCLEEGMTPICFEMADDLGGTWYHREKAEPNEGPCAYKGMCGNDPKELLCFSNFHYPKECPHFVLHTRALQYLHDYATEFSLRKFIHFRHMVTKVKPSANYQQSGQWDVTAKNVTSGEIKHLTVDGVMLCTGFLRIPKFPDIPGMKTFKGEILHAKDFRGRDAFKEKRVMVVGSGIYGGEITGEVGLVAKQVYLSTGSGAWMMPKCLEDYGSMAYAASSIINWKFFPPESVLAKLVPNMVQPRFDLRRYGLGSKELPFAGAGVLLSDYLPLMLLTGSVRTKPHLTRLTETGAEFSDGTSVDNIDSIIFATGLKPDVSIIECDDVKGENTFNWNVYKSVFPINDRHPTFALVGVADYAGTIFGIMELSGRWAARVMSGKCTLPPKSAMKQHLQKMRNKVVKYQNGRHKWTTWSFQQEIADEIGVRPSLWQLFIRSPRLAYRFLFGPQFPVYYRVVGPHALENAVELCADTYNRAFNTPDYTRHDSHIYVDRWERKGSKLPAVLFLTVGTALSAYYYNSLKEKVSELMESF